MSNTDNLINIHLTDVLVPALVDPNNQGNAEFIAPGTKMTHNDAMSGSETVEVVAGPLQITTGADVMYVIKFPEDNAIWLCYRGDLA